MDSIRGSWWSITLNNPTEVEREQLSKKENLPTWVRMVKWQDEVGESGTPHLQIALNTTFLRQTQIKNWLPRAHIECAKTKEHIENLKNYVHKDKTASGERVEIVKEYLTMEKALIKLIPYVVDIEPDVEKYKNVDKLREEEYWNAVNKILLEFPELVQLYTNPQMLRAYQKTKTVWVKHAFADNHLKNSNFLVEQTDSQTDTAESADNQTDDDDRHP